MRAAPEILPRPRRSGARRFLPWVVLPILAGLVAASLIVIDGLHDVPGHADLAIVLGNEVLPDGAPSARLAARLDRAIQLYHDGACENVLVSGSIEGNGFDEAGVMAAYLVTRGVPAVRIIQDNAGIDTYATARNTRRMLHEHGWRSVCVVTQYYHVPRARFALWRFGVGPVYAVHAHFFERRDFFAIGREMAGFVKYTFRRYDLTEQDGA